MKLGFPINEYHGLDSRLSGHFGRAPHFAVVDTKSQQIISITNNDRDHTPGACHPVKSLGEQNLDAVIVSGIGKGALASLVRSGCKIYRAKGVSVADNITCLEHGRLPLISQDQENQYEVFTSGGCHK